MLARLLLVPDPPPPPPRVVISGEALKALINEEFGGTVLGCGAEGGCQGSTMRCCLLPAQVMLRR